MTDELQPQGTQALATIPDDLIRDAGRGTENIREEDVRPPRLLICQAGSPQRKPEDAKQIAGLNELDMFNDLSGDIYGRGPLRFMVINALMPRGIQFAPMDEGGGVIDFNVPLNDPRMQFTTDPNTGERKKPVATKFMDFLVWLPDQQEVAVLSMKGSQLSVAVQLNGKSKLPLKGEAIDPSLKGQIIPDPPAWARTFSLTTVMERDTKRGFAWGNYNLKFEGVTPVDTRRLCSKLADSYAKKNIIVPVEPDETDTSFDPTKLEHESRTVSADM